MNTKINSIIGIVAFFMVLFVGCGNNNNNPLGGGCNGIGYSEALTGDRYNDYAEALNNFTEQQTAESCSAYKAEYKEWVDLIAGLSMSCVPISRQEYEAALAEWRESIDEIDCTQFDGNE